MNKTFFLTLFFLVVYSAGSVCQNIIIDGFAIEESNRRFLNDVTLNIFDEGTNDFITQISSNSSGYFTISLPAGRYYRLEAIKDLYKPNVKAIDTKGKINGEKIFVEFEMNKQPGYILDFMLIEQNAPENLDLNVLDGALIEVYNNTTSSQEVKFDNYSSSKFKAHIERGNYYTIMVRKNGFFTKRIEVIANTMNCNLCVVGVNKLIGIENLNNKDAEIIKSFFSNVDMKPIKIGESKEIKNIQFTLGSTQLSVKSKMALDSLSQIIKDNPQLIFEIGAHTDARGKESANQTLSEERAMNAVEYLVEEKGIKKEAIRAKGYGESEIKNKCKPGVTCTEKEHEENRRIELKVLEISDVEIKMASLNEIKKQEIEGKNIELINDKLASYDADSMGLNVKDQLMLEKLQQLSSTSHNFSEKDSISIEEQNNREHSEILLSESEKQKENIFQQEEIINEPAFNKLPSNEMEKKQDKVLMLENKDPDVISKKENKAALERIAEEKIKKSELKEELEIGNSDINRTYSGYRIVIHFSSRPISEDNEIFSLNKGLITFETPQKNILYLIGDFSTMEEAEKYRIENVGQKYPNSYVIGFEKGERIK